MGEYFVLKAPDGRYWGFAEKPSRLGMWVQNRDDAYRYQRWKSARHEREEYWPIRIFASVEARVRIVRVKRKRMAKELGE